MTFTELLAELVANGIQLCRNGDDLSLRGSKRALSATEIEAIRTYKTRLLACIAENADGWWTPPAVITPAMLSLVDLSQADIDRIAESVPGGAANIKDIYPLTALQEGILFHHLMSRTADAYVTVALLGFDTRARLDAYLAALEAVIARHDILRTAVLWEGLPEPVQVVWRRAPLEVEEVELDPQDEDPAEQFFSRFDTRQYRIDVRKAPMLRPLIARDARNGRWLLMEFHHHLTDDHVTRQVLLEEILAHMQGRQGELPIPVPYRNLVAQTRLDVSKDEHEVFFRKMLGDVRESTTPFGLMDVHGDGFETEEVIRSVDSGTARKLREQARRLGISTASLFHLAWAMVLARVSGREDVVFGTVVFGRMQGGEGADRAMGLFLNTLPIRVQVGDKGLESSALETHALLAELMQHEHASLLLAQRCSAVQPPAPLFSALLNYSHNRQEARTDTVAQTVEGIEILRDVYYTNYPFLLSVNDDDEGFSLQAQVLRPFEPTDLCDFTQRALEQIVIALETSPSRPVRSLDVLPDRERHKLVIAWNATDTQFQSDVCIHELFEAQVLRTPDARALVFGDDSLSYNALNQRANRLAHRLRNMGIGAGSVVGICVERSFEAVVGLLAILKAGGVYVPLDPAYPADRLGFMLEDARAALLLTQERLLQLVDPLPISVLCLDQDRGLESEPTCNQQRLAAPDALAYVIYTSGSTGKPKGVMISHRAACNTLHDINARFEVGCGDSILALSSLAFDLSVYDIFGMLGAGGTVVIPPPSRTADPRAWQHAIRHNGITIWDTAPALMQLFADAAQDQHAAPFESIRVVMLSGDWIPLRLAEQLRTLCPNARLMSFGGATEVSIWSVCYPILAIDPRWTSVPYGRALANQTVYVLDQLDRPCPVGVSGQLHIGGVGVAMGYLNRPELNSEKFVRDLFNPHFGGRMYRTGDRARWMPDGNLEFLGRLDFQVKIRGYRIELGEIEARLAEHPAVRDAVVLVRDFGAGDRRLVAYATLQADYQAAQMPRLQSVQVSRWQEIYEATYTLPGPNDSRDDFAGWNNSYDAKPIPEAEMREWQETAIARIRSLNPAHVLEIGCGSGLMLLPLAPVCNTYTATDFSSETLAKLGSSVAASGLENVRLLHRAADDFEGLPHRQFDTIVINSVIQYFPNEDYLLKVLRGAFDCLAPNGRVFIGDVRNYSLLKAFHTSIQLFRANDLDSVASLREKIQSALTMEKELLVDPDFFLGLTERLPYLSSVRVLPKLGYCRNELTKYRYDAILESSPSPLAQETEHPDWMRLDWASGELSTSRLASLLATEQPDSILVTGLPNGCVLDDAIAPEMLESGGFIASESVGKFRDSLATRRTAVQDIVPQSFVDFVEAAGYHAELSLVRSANDGSFHALLSRRASHRHPVNFPHWTLGAAGKAKAVLTNDPLKELVQRQALEDLKSSLESQLPEYMVPAHFVFLDQLPLSPNGKLDRAGLPAPETTRSGLEYLAPHSETEDAVAAIWCEVLKIDRVGRNDHFFALGGHSLLAMQAVSRISQALGVEISVRDLFARPTLAEFAHGLSIAGNVGLPPITPSEGSERMALSFAQQRLWFLAQLEGVSKAYHIPVGLTLTGELDSAALRNALDCLVARHEALRTTFTLVDGEPRQQFASSNDFRFLLVNHDLRQHPDPDAELHRLVAMEANAPFDLERGPLIRGRLIRQTKSVHALLVTMHHIVSDGWSMAILVSELSRLYAAFRRDEKNPLPPIDVQYADYAAWQRRWISGDLLRTQADFWEKTLAGAPELLDLPTDRPRPTQQDYAGGFVPFVLDSKLTKDLKRLCQIHDTTLYMALLAAWGALLGRLSGQDDLVIGTPSANRGRTEIEGLIGFFVNTLAIRLDLSGSPTVSSLLKRVKAQALAAQHHQDIPFEHVVEIARPARSLAHSPVFQVMFAWQNAPEASLELPGLTLGHLAEAPDATAKFDLLLSLAEFDGKIQGGLEFASALFDRSTVARYLDRFRNLLEAMATDDTCRIDQLPLLSAIERKQVLEIWNDTDSGFPEHRCIHQLFEAQAASTPEALAVSFGGIAISYAELDARADRLASHLRFHGVRPDARVAICMERSLEMVVGVIAILKAGGAYVPLDPTLPVERTRLMLRDCAPVVLLTQGSLSDRFVDMNVPVVDSGLEHSTAVTTCSDLESRQVLPGHPAYVIYTSGSTGLPKGVAVPHRALVNLISWQIRRSSLKAGSATLQFASLGFDVSFQEIFSTLCSGGKLVLIDEESRLDPAALVETIQKESIRRLFLPFVALGVVAEGYSNATDDYRRPLDMQCPLEEIITAGEQLRIDAKVSRFLEFCGHCTLENQYGPTETHVASSYRLPPTGDQWPVLPPIGRPISNARIYILDAQGAPQPIGVTGELYLGGVAVADGYLNRPELTAERFMADPFAGAADARMYKTGDLGRWLPDGNIEFLGRNDFQVKVRGFRVELGEIEAALSEYPDVRECVVVAHDAGNGTKRLLAYYAGDGEAIGPEALRSHLLSRLPDYMVPAAFVRLESLPVTPNGKVDRRALPHPEGDAFASRGFEAPIGNIELALAGIWSDLLKVESVGRNDNFFELGGHSLLVIQVLSRLRKSLGIEGKLGDLFASPTLADFARSLDHAEVTTLPAVRPAHGTERLALSFAQQRLWFLCQMKGISEAYHLPLGLLLTGELDRTALRKALDTIVRRHEALRTTFVQIEGTPAQRIESEQSARFRLIEHDLIGQPDAASELHRLAAMEAVTGFDLACGPLIRGRLIRQAADVHALLITMHHIVSDGWSIGVLMEELSTLYSNFRDGRENPLQPIEVQYADYAAWQRRWLQGELLQRQAAYWKAALAGAPELLELPVDRPRPPVQDHAGASIDFALDSDLAESLRALSQRHGTTLFVTFLAAWAALLSRLSGQQDIVIGTPTANRGRLEVERLIGFFVNTLALRLDLSDSPSVAQLLERVKTLSLEAQHHQDIPFEQVVEIAKPNRSMAHSPLFQVMFTWQNATKDERVLPGLVLEPLGASPQITAKFDLSLFLWEDGPTIAGTLEYATALFDEATLERHLVHFKTLLRAMVADAPQAVDCLPILGAVEHFQVLQAWNDTAMPFQGERCIHELFERQVARTPQAPALGFREQVLSYSELNVRANQLAHHLIGEGIGPEQIVAIALPRGIDLVVSLLAVLKTGAAYLPLDPDYPSDRLAGMLADARPSRTLTWHRLLAMLPDSCMPLCLDDTDLMARLAGGRDANPEQRDRVGPVLPQHPAYVIYTSGSTGKPKGAVNAHAGLVNRLRWMQAAYRLDASDCVLQKTPSSFDVSVWEFFWPLLEGARLLLAEPEGHKDPVYLAGLIDREQVTTVHFVPSMLQVFLQEPSARRYTSLRRVICSGEALSRPLQAQMQQTLDCELHNLYGPTEAAIDVTAWACDREDQSSSVPIGRPIWNTQVYVLSSALQPVPVGVAGELYLAGVGLARGYLNRAGLTAERFVANPFGEPGTRLYRTGDLARWRTDGALEYIGRTDHQIKLRGFRIELGEIEAVLVAHPDVREAVVLARQDRPGDVRLVAYYTANEALTAQALRSHLAAALPDHMVPAAYVHLDALPLTPNGKLDRKALPAPEDHAFATRTYEPPQGEVESILAEIWASVLKLERIGRSDNFFQLGGHSLLAITVIDRMRRCGLHADVRALFTATSLAGLAAAVGGETRLIEVPPNGIPHGCAEIRPEMLSLIDLSHEEIAIVVASVHGGAANVQDIYPLAPLQEGILFHHQMTTDGDPYLLTSLYSFDSRERLDSYLVALQKVMDRHDVLRTAVVWEGLREPVQVVWRKAPLSIRDIALDVNAGDLANRLLDTFEPGRARLDVRCAPMMQVHVAHDSKNGRWLLVQLAHHLLGDHTMLELLEGEIQAHLLGRADQLPSPLPFRNLVAQSRLGVSQQEHEVFFRDLLGDVDEPTLPFGLRNVQGDGRQAAAACLDVDASLAQFMRDRARRLGVSVATLCHVAWAQVLARISGRDDVVFGTVVFGRMQGGEGADRVMGLFINTLPIRILIDETGVEASVQRTHALLADLIRHEHASLALAQRCSEVPAPAPLFSSLLNYRHGAVSQSGHPEAVEAWQGIEALSVEERINYPLGLSVNDLGVGFGLSVQVDASIDPMRICTFMHAALEELVEALGTSPARPIRDLDVLPRIEHDRVVKAWDASPATLARNTCIHEIFEAQVRKTPQALALAHDGIQISYAQLNDRANQLAHHLHAAGVVPDARVAICIERSIDMVVALLAVLKAGGAYVPLDPAYPVERLRFLLQDSKPMALLLQAGLDAGFVADDPALTVMRVDSENPAWAIHPVDDLESSRIGLKPHHLAYVIYTSGSTGAPKGVMIEHQGLCNLVATQIGIFDVEPDSRVLQAASFSFDACASEVMMALCRGASLHLPARGVKLVGDTLVRVLDESGITHATLTPAVLAALPAAPLPSLHTLIVAGDALTKDVVDRWAPGRRLINAYGPTEATVCASTYLCRVDAGTSPPIGQPIANTSIYILDSRGRPVPSGVVGELHIGGAGVARGYLNRVELTSERFVTNPFVAPRQERMYRTGDLGRWLPDGNIEFLGRNDHQVKVRGFRIELGEIEKQLIGQPGIREAVVMARDDREQDRRLVAYYTLADSGQDLGSTLEARELKARLGEVLPDFMVPSAYVRLDTFPLTPNGKLDRKALPAPETDGYANEGFEAPDGEIEIALAALWAEVLGVSRIGRGDDFFELGGHSLLAGKLVFKINQEMEVALPLRSVFETPELSAMAGLIVDAQLAQFDPEELAAFAKAMEGMDETEYSPRRPVHMVSEN